MVGDAERVELEGGVQARDVRMIDDDVDARRIATENDLTRRERRLAGFHHHQSQRRVCQRHWTLSDRELRAEIEVVVTENLADDAIKAIIGAARTGEIGDGRVFVMPVSESYRIRTGEIEA